MNRELPELSEWRTAHNLTQRGMAELLDVTERTISRWEQSGSTPTLVGLALHGLSWIHGPHCACEQCYSKWPQRQGRDPRPTRRKSAGE